MVEAEAAGESRVVDVDDGAAQDKLHMSRIVEKRITLGPSILSTQCIASHARNERSKRSVSLGSLRASTVS